MQYSIIKFQFDTGLHIGSGLLTDAGQVIHADTLFSALCMEIVQMWGEEQLEQFVDAARMGKIQLSDCFPYSANHYYLPKPMLPIRFCESEHTQTKKILKKIKYIPAEDYQEFISGQLDLEAYQPKIESFGMRKQRTLAHTPDDNDANPYHMGVFHYMTGCGLYSILGLEDSEWHGMIMDVLDSLQHSGIGGKRSAGLGKFTLFTPKMPKNMDVMLNNQDATHYINLSVGLPKEDEMDVALDQASYSLIKRSGFVGSPNYANAPVRKKDIYLFNVGSSFRNKFEGEIFDISRKPAAHPIYSYAKPMFLGVNV